MTPPTPQPDQSAFERALARIAHVERAELAGVAWSFAYFFSVLCAYYILRPLRDEMGVTVGQDGLKWLFVIVFLVMIAVVPIFGWVISNFARRKIVPAIYGFFIVNLAIFWVVFQTGAYGAVAAGTFFVWVSVFNLFVVSLFWSLMSDLWRNDQAKRLYGFIAAGGSAGAFAGPLLTQSLVRLIGPNNLLIVSGLLLGVAIAAALMLRRLFAGVAAGQGEDEPVGRRGVLEGALAVWRSPYLFRIALWILLGNFIGTFFYLEQARIVGETLSDRTARVELFARVDLAVSVLTILAQVFLAAAHHADFRRRRIGSRPARFGCHRVGGPGALADAGGCHRRARHGADHHLRARQSRHQGALHAGRAGGEVQGAELHRYRGVQRR